MAQDKVRYLGVLPVVNIELTERAESSSGNCSYGVSDYYIEKVEQQIERLKNEQNFLYDEKFPIANGNMKNKNRNGAAE